MIDVANADELIDALAYAKAVSDKLYGWQLQLREKIAALCEGRQKTQRVRGRRRQAKVTFPDASWEQAVLKEAWHAYPQYRDQLLSLASLRVKKREFDKAAKTAGPDDWASFRDIVASAERPPTGVPSVSIEEDVA